MSTDLPKPNWREAVRAIRWNVQPFVDGKYRRSGSAKDLENINPATESVLCHMPVGDPADINEAVRVARLRFNEGCWSEWPSTRRAEVLMRLADLVSRNYAELA